MKFIIFSSIFINVLLLVVLGQQTSLDEDYDTVEEETWPNGTFEEPTEAWSESWSDTTWDDETTTMITDDTNSMTQPEKTTESKCVSETKNECAPCEECTQCEECAPCEEASLKSICEKWGAFYQELNCYYRCFVGYFGVVFDGYKMNGDKCIYGSIPLYQKDGICQNRICHVIQPPPKLG